jgi:hypothetical protein
MVRFLMPQDIRQHSDVTCADAHRWRFTKVDRALGAPFGGDETGTVFMCGDGCPGPRAEAAYSSGSPLAALIGTLVMNKHDLPQKVCRSCQRPLVWRKKWPRDGPSVK